MKLLATLSITVRAASGVTQVPATNLRPAGSLCQVANMWALNNHGQVSVDICASGVPRALPDAPLLGAGNICSNSSDYESGAGSNIPYGTNAAGHVIGQTTYPSGTPGGSSCSADWMYNDETLGEYGPYSGANPKVSTLGSAPRSEFSLAAPIVQPQSPCPVPEPSSFGELITVPLAGGVWHTVVKLRRLAAKAEVRLAPRRATKPNSQPQSMQGESSLGQWNLGPANTKRGASLYRLASPDPRATRATKRGEWIWSKIVNFQESPEVTLDSVG